MAATYYNITEEEMDQFLRAKGFQPIQLRHAKEKVYGKILKKNICLRVYTGIAEGESRDVGKDAIRVVAVGRDKNGNIAILQSSKRVNRVESWKKNLGLRISSFDSKKIEIKYCRKCGSIMRIRKSRTTGIS